MLPTYQQRKSMSDLEYSFFKLALAILFLPLVLKHLTALLEAWATTDERTRFNPPNQLFVDNRNRWVYAPGSQRVARLRHFWYTYRNLTRNPYC